MMVAVDRSRAIDLNSPGSRRNSPGCTGSTRRYPWAR